MKIIRASEIGTYQYCHRAWWYQQQGYKPENRVEMDGGIEMHEQHGRLVLTSSCLQISAYGFLLVAVLAGAVWLVQLIL